MQPVAAVGRVGDRGPTYRRTPCLGESPSTVEIPPLRIRRSYPVSPGFRPQRSPRFPRVTPELHSAPDSAGAIHDLRLSVSCGVQR